MGHKWAINIILGLFLFAVFAGAAFGILPILSFSAGTPVTGGLPPTPTNTPDLSGTTTPTPTPTNTPTPTAEPSLGDPPHDPSLVLRADFGLTVDSGDVSVWEDQVGEIEFTQSTPSLRPVFLQNAFDSDRPGVYFDEATADIVLSSTTLLNHSVGMVFALVDDADQLQEGVLFGQGDTDTNNNNHYIGIRRSSGSPNAFIVHRDNFSDRVESDSEVPNGLHIIGWSSDNCYDLYLDGSALAHGITGGTPCQEKWFSSELASMDLLNVGARVRSDGTVSEWEGVIGAILVYDSVLGAGARQDVETWLQEYSGSDIL